MVLGAQTEDETGEVVVYTSLDLENWRFQGTLAGSGHHGLSDFGYMWECPDLFKLDGKDILIVCPQGLEAQGFAFNNIFQSGYFAGNVDYEKVSFHHGAFEELDRGFDFYAPQTTTDASGRRILVGWMGNAQENDSVQPTIKKEWIHALTLPRELEWKNGKLVQHPVAELQILRQDEIRHADVIVTNKGMALPRVNGQVFELEIAISKLEAPNFSIMIGEKNSFHYDAVAQVCTFQRGEFSGIGVESRHCELESLQYIRMFKDSSSIEIFVNNGEEVFTSRVFDNPDTGEIRFIAKGGHVKMDVRKWNIKRVTEY